ncbi:D-alanyl-D-alanine carboxypeptidase/D-alanyl-D-alanine endopeptidase [Aquabacterium sp.]|uniref:D-alanyl-D-alanine carboxypeptidase/D-alanyl-D-alanine endopeptidase n=1 Tax=Aquabacterium sp. TaxID=1872578 RepID=UPI003BB19C3B
MRSLRLSPASRIPPTARPTLRHLACGLLLLWPLTSWAQSPTHGGSSSLPSPVTAALHAQGIPAEAVSLWVAPVDGGPPRLEHLSETLRPAASVMKLFTTGAALRTLGPAWTWQTDVTLTGTLRPDGTLTGSVHVRGSGDPSLRMEQVSLMLSRWRGAGLRHIQRDIVLDRTAFQLPAHDPWAFDGKGLRPYNAGPDALLLNHQAVTLHLMPDAARPGQVRVAMEPPLAGVTLDVEVAPDTRAGCGDWRAALDLQLSPAPGWPKHHLSPWRVHVRGPYPLSCGAQTWPVLWPGANGEDFAARLLTQTWRQLGGELDGQVRSGVWPAGAGVWQSWTSQPLAEVVRDINKFSNNVMARQLFLTLGGAEATARTVREATSTHAPSPCGSAQLVLDNGSGLSRTEGSTALCLGQWLQALWASPAMPDLVASLPLTGVDGTTRRWQGAAGYARVKTGSLSGVAAVAGYVDGESGRRHVVVGLVQHPGAAAARPVLDALLNWTRQDR